MSEEPGRGPPRHERSIAGDGGARRDDVAGDEVASDGGMSIGRRAFASLAVGGATASLAGCYETGQVVDDDELDGTTLRVAVVGDLVPEAQFNRFWASGPSPAALDFLRQLLLPVEASTGALRTSGHTVAVEGESVSVPCLVADYEIDAPAAVDLRLDDRLSYWDGTPMDAEALWRHERLRWLVDDGPFRNDAFAGERTGAFGYRRAIAANGGPNRFAARSSVPPPEGVPVHPSRTGPWVERLDDATTRSELGEAREDLFGDPLDFETYLEAGYGSGAFEPAGEDALRNLAVVLRRREDHPGDPGVDNLVVRIASDQGDYAGVIRSGAVGAGHGAVGTSAVPDRVAQLATYPDSSVPATQLVFDWTGADVRRLWVRRAVVAALPLEEIASTIGGADLAVPRHHSGLPARVDERALGASFCESLYDYPVAADPSTAREWLQAAGYAREDGWIGPDGDQLALSLVLLGGGLSTLGRVVRNALRDAGIDATAHTRDPARYESALASADFDLTIGWTPTGRSPLDYYADHVRSTPGLTLPPIARVNGGVDGPDSDPGFVPERASVPAAPGALRIEGAAYADGGAGAHHTDAGETLRLRDRVDDLWAADTDEAGYREAARQCARWYNYALPNLVLARPVTGPWADVEAYAVPSEGSRALRTEPWTHPNPIHYHVQAGTIRAGDGA